MISVIFYSLYLILYFCVKILQLLPRHHHLKGDCSICLEALNSSSEECVTTSECHHHFHLTCLNQWVRKSQTCPLCRQNLNVIYLSQAQSSHLAMNIK